MIIIYGSYVNFNGPPTSSLFYYPTDVNGLSIWLKPESLSGSDGTAVPNWEDSSGNNFSASQAAAGQRPLIYSNQVGSYAGLLFDGQDDRLEFTGGAMQIARSASGHTVFMVTKRMSESSSRAIYRMSCAGGSRVSIGSSTTATQWRLTGLRLDSDSAENTSTSTYPMSGSYTLMECNISWASASGKTWVTASADINDTTFLTTGSTSDTPATFYLLGGAGGAYWRGYITEVVVYSQSLDDLERQKVESYFRTKYSLW